MADIRINALATTAASTASDDFVAVDGTAQGTRKLSAYSPSFGGNLTVTGNINPFTIGPGYTGFAGSIGILGGNGLFIQGKTGTTYDFAVGNNAGSVAFGIPAGTTNVSVAGNLTVSGGTVTSGTGTLTLNSSANTVVLQSAGTTALTLDTSQNATFASNILLAGAKGIGLGGQTNPAVQGILASGNNTNINANSSGAVNIGTASNGTLVTIDSNGVIKSQGGTAITPASASASGTAGMIQWDASYIYVCTAANTWKRVAIATW